MFSNTKSCNKFISFTIFSTDIFGGTDSISKNVTRIV